MKIEKDSRIVNQLDRGLFVTSTLRVYLCCWCFQRIEPKVKHIYFQGDRGHIECGINGMSDPYFFAIVPAPMYNDPGW